MTKVPAYWGFKETSTSACPVGKSTCEDQDGECSFFQGYYYKTKGSPPPIGSVTVRCSAPTKKGKSNGLEPGNH